MGQKSRERQTLTACFYFWPKSEFLQRITYRSRICKAPVPPGKVNVGVNGTGHAYFQNGWKHSNIRHSIESCCSVKRA